MIRNNLFKSLFGLVVLFCLTVVLHPTTTSAQTEDNLEELKQKVSELVKKQKYTEALPLLQRLVIAEPDNPRTHFYLGFSFIAHANVTKNDAARSALRVRARNSFLKAKELGIQEPVVDAIIQSIPPDGSAKGTFSVNAEAEKLMSEAEAFFSQGKLDNALKNYQKALQLDPNIYEAALFSGDVYTQRGDFANAETWYQKAIAIDPKRETAYRYSATPLMKQNKYDQARDRYIEAYITEPYSKYSAAGLTQWAQVMKSPLAHPEIVIPTDVTFDEKGDAKISLSADALLGSKDDGAFAWIIYGGTRSIWRKEKFAKTFPQENTYRHSLAEESDALRSTVGLAVKDGKTQNLSRSLATLKRLDDDGLLEAYILLARPDQGIARDHAAYLTEHRDKLRRYVLEYILTGGGSNKEDNCCGKPNVKSN